MGQTITFIGNIINLGYVMAGLLIVFVAASFIFINKKSSFYEKSLRKKYKKALNAKRLYENEKSDLEVKEKLWGKYNKAVKSLEKKLKMILWFNKKIIYLSPDLFNSTEKFEFIRKSKKDTIVLEDTLKERLQFLINKSNLKTKIIEKKPKQKTQKQISNTTNQTVKKENITISENISDYKFNSIERVLPKKDLENTTSVSIYNSDEELTK